MPPTLNSLKWTMKRPSASFQALLLGFIFFLIGFSNLHAQTPTLLVDSVGAGGFNLGNDFASNGWTVANSANNPWVVGLANTTTPGLYVAANGNARLMFNGGAFVGNHQAGSTTPGRFSFNVAGGRCEACGRGFWPQNRVSGS